MCIVALAWKSHPHWKLIAIGNRDELHARPARSLSRWNSNSHLLAGQDEKAGGTWLGVSEQGRFAVVTNLSGYGNPDTDSASRGDLLRDYLTGEGRYAAADTVQFSDFNPFNLITVTGDDAHVHTNRPNVISEPLAPGIHGLSNGPLHQPWPKSAYLNAALQTWIDGAADDPAALLDKLLDKTPHRPAISNRETDERTVEPQHSGIFICSPQYGTRCSTVMAVSQQGDGMIIERRFDPAGKATGETNLEFSWPV